MGCSGTQSSVKEDTPKLTNEKIKYILRSERLELLASDILDDCLKLSNGTEAGINEIAKEIIHKKNTTNGLTTEEFHLSIKDLYVQQFLFSNHFLTEYDLMTEFEEKFLSKTFNSSSSPSNDCCIVFQSMFIKFQQIQNGITINFNPVSYLEDPGLVNSFYNNLKFNKTFQCELLHFILNKDIVSNVKTCESLSELISCNKRLASLILGIGNDISLPEQINKLAVFLNVASRHRKVQALTLINCSNMKLMLGSHVEEEIIKVLMNCKSLMSFALIGFGVSDLFMMSLAKCLPLCGELKMFLIDSSFSNINILDDLVKGISSSNSLLMVVFGGFNLSKEKIEQYKQVKVSSGGMNRHAVKIFEYVPKIYIE